MEVLEIKVEPLFDEEQSALVNIKQLKNEEETFTSTTTGEAVSLEEGSSHFIVGKEQENNPDQVLGENENIFVRVKTEQPDDLQQDDITSQFSESDDDNVLDIAKHDITSVTNENEFQKELQHTDSMLEGTSVAEMDVESDIDWDEIENNFSGSETTVSEQSSLDSDNNDADLLQSRVWCKVDTTRQLSPSPSRFQFCGASSLNINIDPNGDILQFFNIFFDDVLVDMITTETNRYAAQCLQAHQSKFCQSHCSQWHHTTSNEMRTFLAIIILQGIVCKPEQQLFWSKNPLITTPFFPKIMSYRRFVMLKQYLHFSDSGTYDPENHPSPKLNKIWPVFEYLNEKFKKVYTPDRDITINDSLMLFKERLGWMQYILLERIRFGFKTFMLCESKSGYIWSSLIYTGKAAVVDEDYKELPISSQIVMSLLKPLLNKGYCLTTDSFYTCPQLADILISHTTDTYGTVKLVRKEMPPNLKMKKLKKGEIMAYQRGKVTVMHWKDKKDVILLSTVHNAEMVDVEKRGELKKPKVVIDYNDSMGVVDKVDQHLSHYSIPRMQGKKYYKKVFFHLLEQAFWNSYVLYSKTGGQRKHLEYRIVVIEKMIEKYHLPQFSSKGVRPGTTPNPLRLTERHFPDIIPATEKKTNPTRQCAVCSTQRDSKGKRVRRESRYYCPDCDVGLCVAPCFRVYHTKADF
ncbi:piggyBac transposable element-derived protein 4-like isoform X2 [Limulus polyphemus]|uniref:PiggyBac transposable element-derived protein 4-like isoform X2 n=1 Tax=Limulus polyphemus TaxID=6850 RepID=A0ABM1T5K8_LIMPO|nr:piggyBac transposable element-derived protein 4-like isoform X2 [Limulus polyphemus]